MRDCVGHRVKHISSFCTITSFHKVVTNLNILSQSRDNMTAKKKKEIKRAGDTSNVSADVNPIFHTH